jgi:CDP-glycerol glycerophosphotransferase (TagB/SpsB family)
LTTGRFLPGTGQYPYSAAFRNSAYFRNWQAVLRCEPLREAAGRYGYTLCFFPHAYIRQQLQDFDLSGITLASDAGGSIQALLAETALFITDYSSTAMEVAYIRRPMLYFQFDRETFFAGQSYTKGYFDYTRDGFGDIAVTVDELCVRALRLLENGPEMEAIYRERAETFFTLRDGECCRRAYETIHRLSAPEAITIASTDVRQEHV